SGRASEGCHISTRSSAVPVKEASRFRAAQRRPPHRKFNTPIREISFSFLGTGNPLWSDLQLPSMRQRSGTARSHTIMIPFNSPPVPAVPSSDEEPEGHWQQEVQRWRDVEIRRLESLLSGDSIGSGGQPGGGTRDAVDPLIQQLLDAPNTGESMHRL